MKNYFKNPIFFAIFIISFSAVISQIIFMREFLIIFYGNEITIGFIFAGWFISSAAGSFLSSKISGKIKNKISVYCTCQFILSLILCLSIVLIRYIKIIFKINPGEIIGFFPMILSIFFIIAPICILFGFMFSFGACLIGSISRMYIIEAVGSMIGGLFVSFILINFFPAIHIMIGLGLLNLIVVTFLSLSKRIKFIISFFIFMIIISGIFGKWANLDIYTKKQQFQGYELISSENSVYGNLTTALQKGKKTFFYNGIYLNSEQDVSKSEEVIHFPLLSHPDPKNILLIGAGFGSFIKEALKHPILKLDCVELDPLIIKFTNNLDNPKVFIKQIDARLFIKNTNNKYDCIIINAGPPYTTQLNRYYTVEFFYELTKRLNPGGIICFGLTSSENYISSELRDFLKSIYFSLKESFLDIKVMPGNIAYFLACNKRGILTYDYKILIKRAGLRNLNLKYIQDYYLFSKLSKKRIFDMEKILFSNGKVKKNYDFSPMGYYYYSIFQSSYFKESLFGKILKAVTAKKILIMFLVFTCIIILFRLVKRKEAKSFKYSVLFAVMVMGFAEIGFQIIILLSFQIIYGYMFYKLCFIITSFMTGLFFGSYIYLKLENYIKKYKQIFILNQTCLCIYSLVLVLIFWYLNVCNIKSISWIGENIIFLLLPIIAGFMGGFQFPLAGKLYSTEKNKIGDTAGIIYGVDLLGACLGAFLVSVFLIPLLGVFPACFLIAGFAVISVLMLL